MLLTPEEACNTTLNALHDTCGPFSSKNGVVNLSNTDPNVALVADKTVGDTRYHTPWNRVHISIFSTAERVAASKMTVLKPSRGELSGNVLFPLCVFFVVEQSSIENRSHGGVISCVMYGREHLALLGLAGRHTRVKRRRCTLWPSLKTVETIFHKKTRVQKQSLRLPRWPAVSC